MRLPARSRRISTPINAWRGFSPWHASPHATRARGSRTPPRGAPARGHDQLLGSRRSDRASASRATSIRLFRRAMTPLAMSGSALSGSKSAARSRRASVSSGEVSNSCVRGRREARGRRRGRYCERSREDAQQQRGGHGWAALGEGAPGALRGLEPDRDEQQPEREDRQRRELPQPVGRPVHEPGGEAGERPGRQDAVGGPPPPLHADEPPQQQPEEAGNSAVPITPPCASSRKTSECGCLGD